MEYECLAELPDDLDDFTRGYLECAEWCGIMDEQREAFNGALDPRWSAASLQQAVRECSDFRENYHPLWDGKLSDSRAGHDFYLTRNRHGAGFWDEGLGDAGAKLTEAAHGYGSQDVDYDPDSETLVLL